MIYRKAPPRPPKLLLRIAAAAGAGAIVTACGGAIDHGGCGEGHVCGSLPATCDTDAGDSCGEDAGGGFIVDASQPCVGPDGGATCGLVPNPADAGANDS